MIDLLSLDESEVAALAESEGWPKYRAAQISEWLSRGVPPEGMTNLPSQMRARLAEISEWRLPVIEKKLVSSRDGTIKYLMRLIDGEAVECVFMRYEHGNTVCVSSQVGCAMGCRFCASTIGGKVRNLTPSEMLGQVLAAAADTGERVGGVVMMGIGEPLDNYDNTVKFLRLLTREKYGLMGARHVSLSTCGLAEKILRFASEGIPVTLSLSLHACDDDTRDALMPVNRRYPIAEVLDACRHYFEKTGRRVSVEYTLIEGRNCSAPDARRLAALIHERLPGAHVNLIPCNDVAGTGLTAPPERGGANRFGIDEFRAELDRRGVNATVRRRLGPDINAACGQLRRSRGSGV
jgi:23S rRNA (adenine2503-C2)-methyltransferase